MSLNINRQVKNGRTAKFLVGVFAMSFMLSMTVQPLVFNAVAVVGAITINAPTGSGTGPYTSSGTWNPQGNQCWTNAQSGTFHYFVNTFEDMNNNQAYDVGTDVLIQTTNPAPCNGDFTSPVAAGDRSLGGNWPAIGQSSSPATFNLAVGSHSLCAVLLHVNNNGNDIIATDCLVNSVVNYNLTVATAGTGSGTVTGAGTYPSGTVVVLSATPNSVSTFAGWSGDADCTDGSVTMNSNTNCIATFTLIPVNYNLIVNTTGTGSGTAGVSGSYLGGTVVTLTQSADSGSTFAGWSGDADCTNGSVTMDHSMTCTATFNLDNVTPPPVLGCTDPAAANYDSTATQDNGSCQYTLTVTMAGAGSGTAGTSGSHNSGAAVTLTQSANSDSIFFDWSGDADCTDGSVTMDHSMTCIATFNLKTVDLQLTKGVDDQTVDQNQQVTYTVNVKNNGPDTANNVTVSDVLPAGLTYVSDDSSGAYNSNTGVWTIGTMTNGQTVTLNMQVMVTASSGTITNEAAVDLDPNIDINSTNDSASIDVTVNQPNAYTLSISTSGDGNGVVTGNGINCDSNFVASEENPTNDCSETYVDGTVVNLTATADEDSNFNGSWAIGAGTCTGNTTPCQVTMGANVNLTAHFGLNPVTSNSPTPTPTPSATPIPPSTGGGGGGGGGFVPPPLDPIVIAAAPSVITPAVLGATTLPATSTTAYSSIVISLFSAMMMTGVVMLMIGYGIVPKKLEDYLN